MREIPPSKAYRLLEPGPIVLVTTAHAGRANVMTMGFHMMVQHDPPLIGAIIGPWDHSHAALVATGACVIAIPTVDMARTVVDIGNCSGRERDKLKDFQLATASAKHVSAPLLTGCLANIECRVADSTLSDKYDLHVLRAVAIWIDDNRVERRTLHHNGDGTFSVDGGTVDLKSRMTKWKQFQVDL